mmetsp:Transcript_22788/g.52067  ORF Transcript_22788/g.52067 Transcript_22788/m.52067 type:complete len:224 (-) Transcript_22788:2465-3136(-)
MAATLTGGMSKSMWHGCFRRWLIGGKAAVLSAYPPGGRRELLRFRCLALVGHRGEAWSTMYGPKFGKGARNGSTGGSRCQHLDGFLSGLIAAGAMLLSHWALGSCRASCRRSAPWHAVLSFCIRSPTASRCFVVHLSTECAILFLKCFADTAPSAFPWPCLINLNGSDCTSLFAPRFSSSRSDAVTDFATLRKAASKAVTSRMVFSLNALSAAAAGYFSNAVW